MFFFLSQEKLLASILSQIDQNKANIAMKEAEMGTELVDHLTEDEKESLSRLNPEITDLKKQLITCRSNRMEVRSLIKLFRRCSTLKGFC